LKAVVRVEIEGRWSMPTFEVTVTVTIPDIEGDDADDAINFVTEAIEDSFAERVEFSQQRATSYGE
jgi:hypothetical protein